MLITAISANIEFVVAADHDLQKIYRHYLKTRESLRDKPNEVK